MKRNQSMKNLINKNMEVPKTKNNRNIKPEIVKKIMPLLYSDVVSKGGLLIGYSKYIDEKNMVNFAYFGCNEINKIKYSNTVVKLGFLNIVITDRSSNAKYRYCVRIMNSKYNKTYKRIFVNTLNEIKEIEIDNSVEWSCKNTLHDQLINDNCENEKLIDCKTKIRNAVDNMVVEMKILKNKVSKLFNKAIDLFSKKNK